MTGIDDCADQETPDAPEQGVGGSGDGRSTASGETRPIRPGEFGPADEETAPLNNTPIPRSLAARLYTSHFLSTWNSRLFEFAAVLFLAAIFPGTLLPMSVYAVVRGLSAMVFAEAVGACIDRGDRLAVVRASIIGQRVAVVLSCGLFWLMLRPTPAVSPQQKQATNQGLFVLIVLAACVEKLCSVMNLVSIERDWVVVMTEGNESGRRILNARMRRIDLFCKLAGPLAISLVTAASTIVAVWLTLAMSALSVVAEYFCIAVVYRRVPELRCRPAAWDEHAQETNSAPLTPAVASWFKTTLGRLLPFSSLPFYFGHPAFLPSFSLAILYLTVLSLSGQMITFLLSVGYNSLHVGIARTFSTIFELSATWIAPKLMARIGVVRGGIWSLSWQSLWLTAGVAWFFSDIHGAGTNSIIAATGLTVAVALSRIGLWGFDLCAQNIVQDEVDFDHRGTFSTAEAAFQNLFEVLSYVTTMVFSRPEQFQWPVIISAAAVYLSSALYTFFVRRRRGHLFHSPLPPAQRWIEKTFHLRHRPALDA